jgi:hypothetical protein
MTKSPKRRSPRRKSPKKRSPKQSRSRLPSTPAKEFFEGQRKKGQDGKMYIVRIRSNGVRYWQKCGSKSSEGTHCRFVGPSKPRK